MEEKLDIDKEYYVGVIIDASREVRAPVVMFSTEGGMDIESVPSEKIAQMTVDVLRGFRLYDALNLAVQSKGSQPGSSICCSSHHGPVPDVQGI